MNTREESDELGRRYRLTEKHITLNGEKARIVGITRTFPRIVQIDTGLGCEFSWPTIEHVIANRNGAFKS